MFFRFVCTQKALNRCISTVEMKVMNHCISTVGMKVMRLFSLRSVMESLHHKKLEVLYFIEISIFLKKNIAIDVDCLLQQFNHLDWSFSILYLIV